MASDLLGPWDDVPWDTDPVLAYAKGLADGIEIGNDQYAHAWRMAMHHANDVIEQRDRARAFDETRVEKVGGHWYTHDERTERKPRRPTPVVGRVEHAGRPVLRGVDR
jgi:hypothetical protein